MIRKIIIFISLILVVFCGFIAAQDVSISMNIPDRIIAGEDTPVEIMVNKAGLQGFARFQQELPIGITARVRNSANADFNFEDHQVNLIWLKMPEGENLRFSFAIQAHETLKGSFTLGGKFSFIVEDDRDEISLSPRIISITPSTDIDARLIVDVKDFVDRSGIPEPSDLSYEVACFRQTPYRSDAGDAWIVNLLVSRGDLEKLARVEESIPPGFVAESRTVKNSIFSFNAGVVKFLWMQLPGDPLFIVSYKLIPQSGQLLQDKAIEGTFTFMEGSSTRIIQVIEKDRQLADAELADLQRILASMTEIKEPPDQPDLTPEREQVSEPVRSGIQGIRYRVQVIATRKPVQINRFFKPYGIEGEILSEFHEGWYKYTTGSFSTYREARDFLSRLLRNAGLNEAFVCAYADGKRIAVKTALQLTSQEWFK